jgi:hypothetical protein
MDSAGLFDPRTRKLRTRAACRSETGRPPRHTNPGSRTTPAADARVPPLTVNLPGVKYPMSMRTAASPASRNASAPARLPGTKS